MDWKLIISTFAVALLLFAWAGVVYGALMKNYFAREFGHLFRPPQEFKLGGQVMENLLQGLFLSLLYRRVIPFSLLPALNGLAFGALVGALLGATHLFSTWVNYRTSFLPVLVTAAFGYARMLAAGVLLGVILR